jgi:transcriptional regulator with XRE-family HTH domain
MTTGEIIREHRKALGLTLRQLADRILKDDGTPLSPQYLCDVEADRRIIANPLLVRELAAELGVPAEVLWYGTLPEVLRSDRDVPPQRIVNAFAAFRRSLGGRSHE